MMLDGSILLVDSITVLWNDVFRSAHVEWPGLHSHIFEMLGISYDKPADPAALA